MGALASCPCSHHPRTRPCIEAGEAEQPRFPPAHMRASKLAHDHRGRLGSTSSISSCRSAEHHGKASPPLPSPQGQPRPWYRSFLVASPLSHFGHTVWSPELSEFPGPPAAWLWFGSGSHRNEEPGGQPCKTKSGPLLQWPPPTAKILSQTLSLLELLLSGSHPETRQAQARSHWAILYENSKTPKRIEKTVLITLQGTLEPSWHPQSGVLNQVDNKLQWPARKKKKREREIKDAIFYCIKHKLFYFEKNSSNYKHNFLRQNNFSGVYA